MRCFSHQEKDAVAVCRACGKGLCAECGADTGLGLACRGRCEQIARDYNELVERSIQMHKQSVGAVSVIQSSRESSAQRNDRFTTTVTGHIQWTRRFRSSMAIFHFVVGVVFVVWGAFDREKLTLALVLGFCFIAYGVFGFIQARGSTAQPQPQPKGTQTA